MEQQAHGLKVWMQPLVTLPAPKIFNLRSDPFERAEHGAGDYDKWFVEHLFVLVPAQAIVRQVPTIFPGVSTAAKTGQLLGRSGHGEADKPEEQQLAAKSCSWRNTGPTLFSL
jgi:hypothetical protein